MTHEPPPPPPAPVDAKSSRPWWQFSLRSLLIAMTAFAAFLGLAVVLPPAAALLLNAVIVGLLSGLLAGALFHDFDKARLAALGALAAIVIAYMTGATELGTAVAQEIIRLIPSDAGSRSLQYLLLPLGYCAGPLSLFATGCAGGISTIFFAPRWHRWAISNR